jgi:hypothetical protein
LDGAAAPSYMGESGEGSFIGSLAGLFTMIEDLGESGAGARVAGHTPVRGGGVLVHVDTPAGPRTYSLAQRRLGRVDGSGGGGGAPPSFALNGYLATRFFISLAVYVGDFHGGTTVMARILRFHTAIPSTPKEIKNEWSRIHRAMLVTVEETRRAVADYIRRNIRGVGSTSQAVTTGDGMYLLRTLKSSHGKSPWCILNVYCSATGFLLFSYFTTNEPFTTLTPEDDPGLYDHVDTHATPVQLEDLARSLGFPWYALVHGVTYDSVFGDGDLKTEPGEYNVLVHRRIAQRIVDSNGEYEDPRPDDAPSRLVWDASSGAAKLAEGKTGPRKVRRGNAVNHHLRHLPRNKEYAQGGKDCRCPKKALQSGGEAKRQTVCVKPRSGDNSFFIALQKNLNRAMGLAGSAVKVNREAALRAFSGGEAWDHEKMNGTTPTLEFKETVLKAKAFAKCAFKHAFCEDGPHVVDGFTSCSGPCTEPGYKPDATSDRSTHSNCPTFKMRAEAAMEKFVLGRVASFTVDELGIVFECFVEGGHNTFIGKQGKGRAGRSDKKYTMALWCVVKFYLLKPHIRSPQKNHVAVDTL